MNKFILSFDKVYNNSKQYNDRSKFMEGADGLSF